MKLIIERPIKLNEMNICDLWFYKTFLPIRDGYVLETKINLYEEANMCILFDWLEENTEFDFRRLVMYYEDCISFHWG